MARETLTILKDDLDGSEATESISFSVRGTDYEIDLNDKNVAAFDKALGKWVDAARKASRSRPTRRSSSASVDSRAIRVWAAENGIAISSRGRIPASIIEQYHSAG